MKKIVISVVATILVLFLLAQTGLLAPFGIKQLSIFGKDHIKHNYSENSSEEYMDTVKNLSYRMKAEDVEAVRENFTPGEWKPIGTSVPKLAGEYFLVTGSGKYFRNVTIKPEDSFCIIELDEKGENYRICWGLVNGGRPTSELPSHLMNHEVKVIATGGRHRVIYHAHPANTIALTFVLPLTDEAFTRELWEMAT